MTIGLFTAAGDWSARSVRHMGLSLGITMACLKAVWRVVEQLHR
jgi:hypothetical protein